MERVGYIGEGKQLHSSLVCAFIADQCSNFEVMLTQCSRIAVLFDWSLVAFPSRTSLA